ncbi:MAG: hypothetical protein LUH05_00270 [Candidatus Gastranaerophilales bacterium]|nr:hypothetical protein [Candidatus Gastranaerophilales bacterium]
MEKYPEHAESLGEAIIKARNEIEDAKENGNYDKYIEETLETSKKIKAEIKAQAKADMKAKQREKNTNMQVDSEPVSEENSDDIEISFPLAQQMALVSLRKIQPYFPEKYLIEESFICAKKMINPEYDITEDKNNSMPAYYAILNSLYLCTDDKATKEYLTLANKNDIQKICTEIYSGNMNPIINKFGKDNVLCFSKQPDQKITDKKYESYIKPLTDFEIKKIKQIYQNRINEDCLKPQNGYLRELLNIAKVPDVNICTNLILQYGNHKFLNSFFNMCNNPNEFTKNIMSQYPYPKKWII